MDTPWTRLPCPIQDERDRRELCAILAANGLEVRIVKERQNKGLYKRYLEYRTPQKIDCEYIETP